MLTLGNITVESPTVLAPMAGVTDRDFRLIVRRIGGVGVVTMEFISSKMLLQGDRRVTGLMNYADEERPLSIQIYGSDAATMAEAARIVEQRGADICDINMGCPANKVLKGCAGAALMRDLHVAKDIIRQVRRAVTIPVTVKFRLGINDQQRNFLELGRICQDQGAVAVALHGRTAKQMFRGEADWQAVGELKELLDIPVLGNGDIRTADDAISLLRQTGCDGVMIGRGATRNPWIFKQIAARLSDGKVAEPTLVDRQRLILEHFGTLLERDEPLLALHKMRTFTQWYSHGLPQGQALRRKIQSETEPEPFFHMVERFLQQQVDSGLHEAA